MIGTSISVSQSRMIKSAGKKNLSTFMKTSSLFHMGLTKDLFANCKVNVVGLAFAFPSCLKTETGNRFIRTPKSKSTLPTSVPPIIQGIVRLLRPCNLGSIFFL